MILELQSNGRMMFTANVNAQRAIEKGAQIRTLGADSQVTRNLVIDVEQMGLGKEYFAYHGASESNIRNAITGFLQ